MEKEKCTLYENFLSDVAKADIPFLPEHSGESRILE